jgi:uncharacterized membrane protein
MKKNDAPCQICRDGRWRGSGSCVWATTANKTRYYPVEFALLNPGVFMFLLLSGLIVWSVVHLFPSLLPGHRKQLVERLGNGVYQGVFALLIMGAVLLMVLGWRITVPTQIYTPGAGLRHLAMLLVVVGFVLMAAANFAATRVRMLLDHPQLTGLLCWASAHLLLNGDSRSIALFGIMLVWSVVSIIAITRRDGRPARPDVWQPWWKEGVIVVAGVVVAALLVRFHSYLSGVPLIPS